jgi:ketosteroid isomerase-like protein
VIRRCYAAFNARDLDAALGGVHADVDWPNAIDGGRVRGHEEVRGYWTRQFETGRSEVMTRRRRNNDQSQDRNA